MDGIPLKKFFAIFLFLIITFATTPAPLKSETLAMDPGASLPLSALAIPEETGKVQERFAGSNTRTIIQIQDVHAHAPAQQNIAAILERLRTVFGIEKAALEGAWSSTSLPKSHAIPTSREKQLLATTLLEDDWISGPIYAAIMSPEPITLVGIEDEPSYEKNRALFLAHLGKAKEIDEKLQVYEASLQTSQRSVWGPELLSFGSAFGKFRETSDLGKFLPLLLKASDTLGAVSLDLTQVLLLRNITALEKSFVKERLENEVEQVIKKYKNRPWTLEELIRGNKIPPEEVGLYPEIKKLTRLYSMRDQVSLRDLTDQIGILTGRVLEKLLKTPEERFLWGKTERFYLSKRILLLQATPEDMRAYAGAHSSIETELAGAGLSESLALSLEFYETVKHRDEIFFQKIMTDPALAGNIAVVTGGFHTDGLSQKFRDAGISYITISPELGGTAMNEKLYVTRMAEGGGWRAKDSKPKAPSSIRPPPSESQTLSELRNAPVRAELRFPVAKEVLDVTNDLRLAEKAFAEGTPARASASDQIAYLRSQRRLVPKNADGGVLARQEFFIPEFMSLSHGEQLAQVKTWARGPKVMAVSTIDVLQKMLEDPETEKVAATFLVEIKLVRDMIVLVQKADQASKINAELLDSNYIERFVAKDIRTLWSQENGKFGRMRKRFPAVIIQDGFEAEGVAVLPARPVSWIVYRLFALNPELRPSAGNMDFLNYLAGLMTEIRSQELPKKSV